MTDLMIAFEYCDLWSANMKRLEKMILRRWLRMLETSFIV